ncbi:filamentous hemagglutinin N-terminal domain-containing protein [Leptolyngbya sp. NK1-12]|uniref:Filamentous hemagglutinin N-terminal domain-containing protein n=1 Tax=Leptolyngbya sp. NK1-12 TaxID=2547451 RepID=A0AA96WCG6_9CYAN|nr:S-layer family protein [Leptolyngbya sp. NK1-12]WNZ22405.1 filamentous hemagglutinin N-terminal domain-containing protein [Leptolyngbya sp. NK1-12]
MKLFDFKFWLINGSSLFWLLTGSIAVAQIRPDNTLPENSAVTRRGNTTVINRGTRRERNLFHSFDRFSVPRNNTASFQEIPPDVERIFARVTGSNRSVIDGLIEMRERSGRISAADLFLLNPNGIIFGKQAALNIGGSFIASTANHIQFADGFQFSAVNPRVGPLLTVQVPIGLQFGPRPGAISNRSAVGLQVDVGQSLGLVGGPITMTGGSVATTAGRVELAAVGRTGVVNLLPHEQGWRLELASRQNLVDIRLSNHAAVNTGNQGGEIQIQGRRITFTQGSVVAADASTGTSTGGQAGRLRVVASQLVELSGVSPEDGNRPTELRNEVYRQATGEEGRLIIETRRLVLRDGAQISTGTYGAGRGVDLTIRASESVDLIGAAPNNQYPSGLFARTRRRASGNSGNLTIDTRRLTLQAGAQISTDTLGAGDAGNVTVNALESIEVAGRDPDNLNSKQGASGLFGQVRPNATGNGGNLTLQTEQLIVRGGAQISSNTFGAGRAGTVTVNAADSVLLSGTAPVERDDNISGILVSAEPGASGNARRLTLTTPQLTIEDGARISADNFGSGNRGGVAQLNVANLILDRGEIKATTVSGQGGIIRLSGTNSLRMQNRSQITARAEADASGGNIFIDAPNGFITAAPNQDNNILASANRGQGGNIRIDARGILGLAERRNTPQTSDIDASSDFGAPGTVIINSPEIDPSTAPPDLPSAPIRSELAQGCQAEIGQATAAFFNTGRGGIPPTPYEPFSSSPILEDVRLPSQTTALSSPSDSPVEAQGWIKNQHGDVLLVAELPAHPAARCQLR